MPRNRRSLSKAISNSQRVNKLSDKGALLYSWLIPWYDDDGRINGDPEDIRLNVVPRRSWTTEDVALELLEMDNLGLIDWFWYGSTPVVVMDSTAWGEHQTFHGIKKIPSKFPAFDPLKYHKVKDNNTTDGVPQHQEWWTTPPDVVTHSTRPYPQNKLKEEKLNKETKVHHEGYTTPPEMVDQDESTQASPVSELKHFTNQIMEEYSDQLIDLGNKIISITTTKKFLNPFEWIQVKLKNGVGHPQAMIDSLKATLDYWDTIKGQPWGYADSVYKSRLQHYRDEEYREQFREFNEFWQGSERVKDIIKGFLKEVPR